MCQKNCLKCYREESKLGSSVEAKVTWHGQGLHHHQLGRSAVLHPPPQMRWERSPEGPGGLSAGAAQPQAVLCLYCCFAVLVSSSKTSSGHVSVALPLPLFPTTATMVSPQHFSLDGFSLVTNKPFHPRAWKCTAVNQES